MAKVYAAIPLVLGASAECVCLIVFDNLPLRIFYGLSMLVTMTFLYKVMIFERD